MKRGLRRWSVAMTWLAAAAMASLSCGDSAGVGGRPSGGLGGGGGVVPECGVLGQVCLQASLDAPMALGSTVELWLDFATTGSGGSAVSLASANPDIVTVAGSTVHAVGEGMSGILFVDDRGAALDFLHVWVAPPDELRILGYSRQGDLLGLILDHVTLLVGDEILVAVEPFKAAQPLLGNFVLEREVMGDAVIVVPDAVGGLYRLVARGPGESTVVMRGLGLEASWDIEVLP